MSNLKVLAIDTSCDETSVAILEGRKVLANVVSSQVELHKKWGGVVPDIARRAHEENLPSAYNEALKRSRLKVNEIDLIAVTQGPGLAIDLEVGIKFAKELALKHQKPFVPVNHMEGHLLSGLLLNSNGNGRVADSELDKLFPAIGLLVSGKHTELIYLKESGEYKKFGWTLDDAAGEAFDKFGRMLGFGYPGGPIVSEFAKRGKENQLIQLPIPMERSGDFNFSYSGLKTSCLYKLEALKKEGYKESELAADFCYAFVEAIKNSLTIKLKKAIEEYPEVKSLFVGGGVYKSEYISRQIGSVAREYDLKYILPEPKYRGDNAAMIGLVAVYQYERVGGLTDKNEIEQIDRVPRLSLPV